MVSYENLPCWILRTWAVSTSFPLLSHLTLLYGSIFRTDFEWHWLKGMRDKPHLLMKTTCFSFKDLVNMLPIDLVNLIVILGALLGVFELDVFSIYKDRDKWEQSLREQPLPSGVNTPAIELLIKEEFRSRAVLGRPTKEGWVPWSSSHVYDINKVLSAALGWPVSVSFPLLSLRRPGAHPTCSVHSICRSTRICHITFRQTYRLCILLRNGS